MLGLVLSAVLTCAAPSLASAQSAAGPDELTELFAGCVGRMSAELEHHWLIHSGAPTQIERTRAAMIELLDLVSGDTPGPWVLARRIEAKFAHAALLTRASFNADARDAAWALRRAEEQVAACRSLLLS